MLVLYLAALVASAVSQTSSACSFQDASGYNLKWSTQNGLVYFNLTFTNFQPNTYTGVAFGDNAAFGMDGVLVSVAGSQVQVTNAAIQGQNAPRPLNDRTINTQSASYRDRVLSAQFTRPLSPNSNNQKSLSGCNTWNFYTTPGQYNNGQFSVQNSPRQTKVCNIEQTCRGIPSNGLNLMAPSQNEIGAQNAMYSNGGYSNNNYNANSNGYNPNQGFNNQQNYQYQPQGQGVNFGYNPNTATPPPSQPYTGAPFVYTTTSSPTGYNSNNFNNGQLYSTGAGASPDNTRMFDPYNGGQGYSGVGQGAQTNQRMYDASNTQHQTTNYNQQNQRMYDPSRPNTAGQNQHQSTNYNQNQRMFDANANQYQNQQYQGFYSTSNANQANSYNQQNQRMYDNKQYNPSAQNQRIYDPNQQNFYGQNNQQPQYPPMPYTFQQPQQYGRKRRSVERVKRQTPGYQPTNNIYGYNYDRNSQTSGASLVMNPNYRYLSGPLADEYSRTYTEQARMYDPQNPNAGASGSSSMNLNGNAPVLNNQQQNQANYQQIQQDYARNPNPSAYTNNIYGYNYASSGSNSVSSVSSSSSSASASANRQYDPSSSNLFYPANPYAPTVAPPTRQFDQPSQNNIYVGSGSNLKETTLRDPNQYQQYQTTGVQRDYVPGTSPNIPFEYNYFDAQTGMFYPYRTTTNWQPFNSTYYDTNGVVSSSNTNVGSSSGGNSAVLNGPGVLYDSTTGRMRDGSDACALQDPYWCDYYVQIFMSSETQYNFSTQPMACQALISSLQDSYNGCCNTVRNAGCRA